MSMQADAAKWWFVSQDQRRGPVTEERLADYLARGAITTQTLVWTQGMAQWTPMGQVGALHALVGGSQPPDLPARSPVAGGSPTPAAAPMAAPTPAPAPLSAPPANLVTQPIHQPATAGAADALAELPLAGPWRRFFARFIDAVLFALPAGFLLGVLSNWIPELAMLLASESNVLWGIVVLPVALVIEAAVFGTFGSTPGKALLQVYVRHTAGGRLSGTAYLERQVGVWWYGYAMGLPLINMFTMALQHGKLKRGEPTRWDAKYYVVRATPNAGLVRWFFAVVTIWIGLSLALALGAYSQRTQGPDGRQIQPSTALPSPLA